MRATARVVCLTLLAIALTAFGFSGAKAKQGENNRGGSDRSDEVRQNDHDSRNEGVTEDNDADGVPNNVPDDGDNRHPSGRDRSVENGNSGNQGNSPSDPDGMSNGGADKPGGTGGIDKLDQDGNNGCGNDDDFEDDNNGRCLGHADTESAPLTRATNAVTGGRIRPLNLSRVAAAPRLQTRTFPILANGDLGEVRGVGEDVSVLAAELQYTGGDTGSAGAASGVLPLSGSPIDRLVAIGVGLVLAGLAALRLARRRAA